MWEDLDIFIRVIRSLTCYMSPVDLGQDPTVTTLSDKEHEIWRIQTKGLGHEAPIDFPTFVITLGGASGRLWYTIGLPIWTSVSLLGRGTCVWLVQDKAAAGPVLVLKNTWRKASCLSESTIYGSISGHHPALAKFYLGQDVLYPGEERPMTVSNVRGKPYEGGDVFLHRLILESRGRPLWKYRSEKELLQGIRAALSAHQFLCDQGILHRDVSIGNIMLPLGVLSEVGAESFLMDLEFACLERSSIENTTITTVPPLVALSGITTDLAPNSPTIFGPDVLRGAAMTGTAQFMAADILNAIVNRTLLSIKLNMTLNRFANFLRIALPDGRPSTPSH